MSSAFCYEVYEIFIIRIDLYPVLLIFFLCFQISFISYYSAYNLPVLLVLRAGDFLSSAFRFAYVSYKGKGLPSTCKLFSPNFSSICTIIYWSLRFHSILLLGACTMDVRFYFHAYRHSSDANRSCLRLSFRDFRY